MSISTLTVIGNTGQDARYYPDSDRALLRLAVNSKVKQGDAWVEACQWFSVVVKGAGAGNVAEHVGKGSQVAVSGRLQLVPMITMPQTGEVFYRAVLYVSPSNVQFLSLKAPADQTQDPATDEPTAAGAGVNAGSPDEDEIPF